MLDSTLTDLIRIVMFNKRPAPETMTDNERKFKEA
eukprot:gene27222-biopygen17757